MRLGKPMAMNENRQYFSGTSKNNGVLTSSLAGPLKKIGTLGLFFRKVCNNLLMLYCALQIFFTTLYMHVLLFYFIMPKLF